MQSFSRALCGVLAELRTELRAELRAELRVELCAGLRAEPLVEHRTGASVELYAELQ